MGLMLKRPKSSFYILRKSDKTLSFHFKSNSEFKVLICSFVVGHGWYNFFQLGLVSSSDKHCMLYQGVMTKCTYAFLKLTVF